MAGTQDEMAAAVDGHPRELAPANPRLNIYNSVVAGDVTQPPRTPSLPTRPSSVISGV
jgi:hypothetical protein